MRQTFTDLAPDLPYRYLQRFSLSLLLLTGICGGPILLPAQSVAYDFSVLTMPQGQNGNNVQQVFQDEVGYLWFASQGGLHRYDGSYFETFLPEPGNPRAISIDYVECIIQDRKGYLWLGTYGGGLNRFDPQTELFTAYRHQADNPQSLTSDSIFCLTEAPDGAIWVGTTRGLNRFDPATGQVKRYQHDPKDPHSLRLNYVQDIYFDQRGSMWVGCGFPWLGINLTQKGGLHRYLPEKDHFVRYLHDPDDPHSISDNDVWQILEDSKGNFWVATDSLGLNRFDHETGRFEHFPLSSAATAGLSTPDPMRRDVPYARLRRIFEDQQGRLWLLTHRGGINVWDPNTQELTTYRFGDQGDYRLSHQFHWNITQLKDGSIWLCGGDGGNFVAKGIPKALQISLTTIPIDIQHDSHIQAISRDQEGQVWVGTSLSGAFRFNQSGTEVQQFSSHPGDTTSLSDYDIHSLEVDQEGFIWLGGAHGTGGVSRLDPRTGEARQFFPDSTKAGSIGGLEVFFLQIDAQNQLWASGSNPGFLQTYSSDKQAFVSLSLGKWSEAFVAIKVSGLLPSADGGQWVMGMGQISGSRQHAFLAWYDPTAGHSELIWQDSLSYHVDEFQGYPHSFIQDIKGKIWFAQGKHIFSFSPATKAVRKYTLFTENAQPRWLIPGQKGELYAGIWDRLYRINPETEQAILVHAQIGKSGVHDFGAVHQVDTFQWLIAYGKSYYEFDPRNWEDHAFGFDLELKLSSLQIAGKKIPLDSEVLPRSLAQMSHLELDHDNFPLHIKAVAPQYLYPKSFPLRYRMLPTQPEWQELNPSQAIIFSTLSPGDYQLEVQCLGPNQDWSIATQLEIHIAKPWWNQWWAYLCLLTLLAGIIYLVVYLRTLAQQRKLAQQAEKLAQVHAMNEQLRQVDLLKDQFLANTSHELRTPLNGIIGLSEGLLDQLKAINGLGDKGQGEMEENLQMIISSGKRLSSLVNDILDFSKLKNREIELRLKPLDIKPLVSLVLRVHQPLIVGKDLRLSSALPETLSPILADEDRVQQILFNLIGNATKFTERGEVQVGLKESSDTHHTFYVKDSGIGIPEEKQAAIFQAFEQADGSIQRAYAGTGLGLSITKRLVDLHQGHLWVESELGVGSTFFFSIPLAKEGLTVLPEAQAVHVDLMPSISSVNRGDVPTTIGENQLRVLVVDDEPINQQVIKNHLKGSAYHLTQAMNGDEALALLAKGPAYDLVLLDVMMPRMSGYEVCQKIREKYLPSELPIIMVTAKNQVSDLVQGLDLGANDYLAKPFTKAEFLARLRTHLNLHRIHEVTHRFVPSEFIRSLGKASLMDLQLGDQAARQVTVFFSDIRDYTGLSEQMSPEENFGFVNAYAGRMGPIIGAHHGFVNQYLGDGIMAIFQENPDDALQAAIEMQKTIETYNLSRFEKARRPIRVGMGLHTGPLIMGIIGDQHRTEAATISDTVNTASRMESLTKRLTAQILLSGETVAGLKNPKDYRLRYLGQVRVKGRQAPIGVYECFDPNPGEIKELKNAWLAQFDEAVKHYARQNFAQAIVLFQAILQANPEDGITARLLAEAKQYLAHGVPEGWVG